MMTRPALSSAILNKHIVRLLFPLPVLPTDTQIHINEFTRIAYRHIARTYTDLLSAVDAEAHVTQDDLSSWLIAEANSIELDGSEAQPGPRRCLARMRIDRILDVIIEQVLVTIQSLSILFSS